MTVTVLGGGFMKRLAFGFVALLALSASPQQEKPSMVWAKTWKEALEEAVIRNVPIYYTVHKDG
jgi:hypothetical protein